MILLNKGIKVKKVLSTLMILFLTAGIFCCQKTGESNNAENKVADTTSNVTTAKTNGLAPGFTLKLTNGKDIKLSDHKGKIVIIDFWATWCPPCRRGIPDLIDIQKKYSKDVVVIGISLDTETIDEVIPFIKKFKINYPIAYGTAEVVEAFGNIEAIPTSFIIDKSGQIVDKHIGLVDKSVYINTITELLKKS
jgi:cytochrome c biogenesis protein CcmG/thiol:disulfide interchange protein DsbE